jgi:hypothetical protein
MLSDVVPWFHQRWVTELILGLGIGAAVFATIAGSIESLVKITLRFRRGKRVDLAQPPWLAEALLCIFARAKDVDALMGDFEELFARDCESGISSRRAVARYWARVLRSIGPQMWQAFKRLGLFGLIAAALRR